MAATGAAMGANPQMPQSSDLTQTCFRDQRFLDFVGGFLCAANVFDYFAASPFYDPNCNNEQLRMKGIHPLDSAQLKTMVGWEYVLQDVKEPLLFVLKRCERKGPEDLRTPTAIFHVLDGNVYQAPTLHAVISTRVRRSLYHLGEAFSGFRALLRDKKSAAKPTKASDSAAPVEAVDSAQAARMDIILRTALQRLPPTPHPKLLQAAPPPVAPPPALATSQDAGPGLPKEGDGEGGEATNAGAEGAAGGGRERPQFLEAPAKRQKKRG